MSGMLNQNILEALNRANFEKITKFIMDVCGLLVKDYEQRQLKLPNDENRIRSIMLEEYMRKQKNSYGMSDYRFDLEVPENYVGNGQHIGRIDIRILLKSDFEKEDAYYVIECKRIDGTSDLNKKYVREGVARFVTQKYSSYYGRNIMLGFVVKKMDMSANAQLIEGIQNSDPDERMHGKFEHIGGGVVTESYKCIYRIQEKKVELRHIFTDYSGVIDL